MMRKTCSTIIILMLGGLIVAGAGCGSQNVDKSVSGEEATGAEIKYNAAIINETLLNLIQQYCQIIITRKIQPETYKDINICQKIFIKKSEDDYTKCVKNPNSFYLTTRSEGKSDAERCHDTIINTYEMLIRY